MRTCRACDGEIPAGRRSDAVYCSKPCKKRVENRARYVRVYTPLDGPRVHTRCIRCRGRIPATTQRHARYCSKTCKRYVNGWTKHTTEYARSFNVAIFAVPFEDWAALVRRYGGRCAYCRKKGPLDMEHVVPLSRGGQHSIGNVVPACRACNVSKKDRLLVEWRK